MTNRIEYKIGKERYTHETLAYALGCIAHHFKCEVKQLTCESADPVISGRMVWVYRGEFDADTAVCMFIPTDVYRMWALGHGAVILN